MSASRLAMISDFAADIPSALRLRTLNFVEIISRGRGLILLPPLINGHGFVRGVAIGLRRLRGAPSEGLLLAPIFTNGDLTPTLTAFVEKFKL